MGDRLEHPEKEGEVSDQVPLKKTSLFIKLLPVFIILVVLIFSYAMGWYKYLSLEALRESRLALANFVEHYFIIALLGYIFIYFLITTLSFPGAAFLTIVGGFMFGIWLGGLAALSGALSGAVAIFLVAKTTFGEVLRQRAGGFIDKLGAGFQKDAFFYLLTLRLIPAAPFFIVNLVPAFFGVKLRDFVLASAIGMIPGAMIYASFGAAASVAFARGETPNLSLLTRPELLLAVGGLIVLSLLPIIFRRFQSRSRDL